MELMFFDPGGSRTRASLTDGRADTTMPRDSLTLQEADELSKALKKTIKRTARRRLQVKAASPDTNEARGINKEDSKLVIEIDGSKEDDPLKEAEHSSNFFISKANKLSSKTSAEDEI